MRALLLILLALLGAAPCLAQPAGQRFVAIAFHDVSDTRNDLGTDSVTTAVLVQFFDWLKGSGWTAVSLDDLAAAARGTKPLPDKAILITFDDGYRSLYTRVFPLARLYRFPIVSGLVGSWMEDSRDGTVLYGDRRVPRSTFITWQEAREMQASGLIEFASHSYGLHNGVQANPQGNMVAAATTWRYDPATGRYETDAQYRARIRADLQRARAQFSTQLGHPPRAIIWPYGRYSGPGLEEAKAVGFTFSMSLTPEPAYTSDLFAIHRYFPAFNPSLADIVRNLRFEPGRPSTRRIACLTLDAMAAVPDGPAQDEMLGRTIDGLRTLGANTVIIDGNAALPAADAPLGDVFFPTRLRPMRRDLLSRATWQIRTRGGADVYLHLPLDAAARAVGTADVPTLFADMMRQTAPDGLAIDVRAPSNQHIVADRPDVIKARRAALDPATLDGQQRLGLSAYRAAAFIEPQLRLIATLGEAAGPPDWVDIGLLPPTATAGATADLATTLRRQGWFRPDVSGRVALALPADPGQQADALTRAQRQGAAAFALCPPPGALPPSPGLPAVFSAATYPYRP